MKFIAKCMYVDRSNANGVFYPKDVVETMVGEFNDRDHTKKIGTTNERPTINMDVDLVSHIVTSLRVEGDRCIIEGDFLDTPLGRISQELALEKCIISINPLLMGTIDDNILGIDTRIVRFDISSTSEFASMDNIITISGGVI